MKENKQENSYRDTLREKRVQYHMTQAQVAEALGVSVITVGRWERGQAMPTPYCIKKLCQLFSATPAELGLETKQSSPTVLPGKPAFSQSPVEEVLPFSLEEEPVRDSFEKNHAEATGSYDTIGVDVYPPLTQPASLPLTPSPSSLLFPLRKRLQWPFWALVCIGLLALLIIIWSDFATGAKSPFIHTVVQTDYDATVAKHGVMFGFDAQHTHDNPFEHILSPNTVSGLVTAWSSYPTGNNISSSPAVANGIVSSPAVADGVVYVGSWDNKLYAYSAKGCRKSICPPLWTSDATGDGIESSPTVANGTVYVGSYDGNLYAFHLPHPS